MATLPDDTRIGRVSLTISDLSRSVDFYKEQIGMNVIANGSGEAELGVGSRVLLELHELPGAVQPHRTAGLYHFAILVPSRYHLARSLHRIAETRTPVQGFADHLVSEAIYLPDPDGNGIEIYRDRSRSKWPREPDGSIRMANAPLDIEGILGELGSSPPDWTGLHEDTVIGHMHLHVALLEDSESFYRDGIGFDLLLRFGPSASFFSAGGYHHHLGINTWAGVGAPPPSENSVGLRWFEVLLPGLGDLEALEARLDSGGFEYLKEGSTVFVRDPSQNMLKFVVN